jgi:hypothetical protein
MKITRFFILLIVAGLSLVAIRTALATPDAPRVVVNSSTLACDPVFYWRDECGEAVLPSGWEFSAGSACPAGYTVSELKAEWSKYQNDFCCQARGGGYCPAAQPGASPSPLVGETPTPAPSAPDLTLPLAGGASLLAGLAFGAYKFLTGKNKA